MNSNFNEILLPENGMDIDLSMWSWHRVARVKVINLNKNNKDCVRDVRLYYTLHHWAFLAGLTNKRLRGEIVKDL